MKFLSVFTLFESPELWSFMIFVWYLNSRASRIHAIAKRAANMPSYKHILSSLLRYMIYWVYLYICGYGNIGEWNNKKKVFTLTFYDTLGILLSKSNISIMSLCSPKNRSLNRYSSNIVGPCHWINSTYLSLNSACNHFPAINERNNKIWPPI